MVTSVGAAGTGPSRITPKTTTQDSTTSFAEKLAGVLQEFLYKAGEDSHVEFDIQAVQGQDPGTRQFVVTVKDATSVATTRRDVSGSSSVSTSISTTSSVTVQNASSDSAKAAAAKTPAEPVYTLMGIPRPPASATATPAASAPVDDGRLRLANGKLVTNEYEAYWASQPPIVQQLMNMPEYQKGLVAKDLADLGYKIDVPIMLWGWDPLATMTVRKNQGFTWVPSANMNPVEVGPGLDFPGKPSYDAENIPVGGIPVSFDWAKGFEHTSPWLRFEQAS